LSVPDRTGLTGELGSSAVLTRVAVGTSMTGGARAAGARTGVAGATSAARTLDCRWTGCDWDAFDALLRKLPVLTEEGAAAADGAGDVTGDVTGDAAAPDELSSPLFLENSSFREFSQDGKCTRSGANSSSTSLLWATWITHDGTIRTQRQTIYVKHSALATIFDFG